jgi:hypothetical protein
MRYRKQTSSGDYSFGNSQYDFVSGAEAVAQAIKTRLKLLKNEWWEDKEEGLPLFQSILQKFGSSENISAADLLIQDIIAGTPGVLQLKDFNSVYDSRSYSISGTVVTEYGESELEVSF